MLSKALEQVHLRGWFDTSRAYEKALYLSQGASQSMLLSRDGHAELFVKFSLLTSLETEALRTRVASERFPSLVPAFVGYARCSGFDLLASRAIYCRDPRVACPVGSGDWPTLASGLERFFRLVREQAAIRTTLDVDRSVWVAALQAFAGTLRLPDLALRSLALIQHHLSALPPTAQHGDLVVNNLGLSEQGRLVIFDWEDWGAIDLPGLDLFTMEFSLGTLWTKRLEVRRSWCDALGIEEALYHELLPGYALVFRYLKRNYGVSIQHRGEELMKRLAR